MPIIIDPSTTPPAPPVTAVGLDGVLTAIRDDVWAGVTLIADYSATSPMQVRFVRVGVDGVETRVRSGDPAWAPGGVAVAYDHEAPLGEAVSWYAYPIDWELELGDRSAGASLTIPEPEPLKDMWFKCLSSPALSMRVLVQDWPTQEYDERQQRFDVLDAAAPVAGISPWALASGTATVLTETLAEQEALLALLTSGSILLAQTLDTYGRPDAYVVPGKVTESLIGAITDPGRSWTFPVTGYARPPTVDTPLRIPGRSYKDSAVAWPTYADRTATGQTYGAVTTGV